MLLGSLLVIVALDIIRGPGMVQLLKSLGHLPMARQKFSDAELIDVLHVVDGNVTHAAEALGVTRHAIVKRRDKLPEGILAKDIDTFRQKRADTLARVQQIMLQYITPEKLKKASLSQLVLAFGLMFDKERLEQGKPTEHVAHAHLSKMHPDDLKMIKEMVKQSTERKLKASQASHKIVETG
jgi:hypothetical protein